MKNKHFLRSGVNFFRYLVLSAHINLIFLMLKPNYLEKGQFFIKVIIFSFFQSALFALLKKPNFAVFLFFFSILLRIRKMSTFFNTFCPWHEILKHSSTIHNKHSQVHKSINSRKCLLRKSSVLWDKQLKSLFAIPPHIVFSKFRGRQMGSTNFELFSSCLNLKRNIWLKTWMSKLSKIAVNFSRYLKSKFFNTKCFILPAISQS